jgi:hypothetical protein
MSAPKSCGRQRRAAVIAAGLLLAAHGPARAADAPAPQPGAAADPLVPPSPPGQPTLRTLNTKTTTRLWGADPYAQAVAVTQHLWTAARPKNAPGENDNVPDRPWGIVLVTADDPLTAISAVPLVHFPDDAPILYVTKTGIPQVTLDEIKRLGDTGILRDGNVDVIVVGETANPGVLQALDGLKLKHDEITAPDVFQLADKIDQYYGRVSNPDTGVPALGTSASSGGNGMMNVMVGSNTAWQYLLPATHWASHMATGLFWVTKDTVPDATINALKRRRGMAHIYVFGGPDQVSAGVVRQLSQYGSVSRIDNDDPIAFNKPPKNDPVSTAIAFAKMWDPAGMVGWNITGPGHGFTLVNVNDWQAAVASAPLSHIGFHAPLLLTDSADTLPKPLDDYFTMVAPTYLNTPAQGPYNMTYVLGTFDQISWQEQAHVDFVSEMSNRRVWTQSTGSMYNAGVP